MGIDLSCGKVYYTCAEGHRLEFSDTDFGYPSKTYTCASCNRTTDCKEKRYSCFMCKWNLCLYCANVYRPYPATITNCMAGHMLEYKENNYPAGYFVCGLCKRNYQSNKKRWNCAICNYDICFFCRLPGTPANPLPLPPQGATGAMPSQPTGMPGMAMNISTQPRPMGMPSQPAGAAVGMGVSGVGGMGINMGMSGFPGGFSMGGAPMGNVPMGGIRMNMQMPGEHYYRGPPAYGMQGYGPMSGTGPMQGYGQMPGPGPMPRYGSMAGPGQMAMGSIQLGGGFGTFDLAPPNAAVSNSLSFCPNGHALLDNYSKEGYPSGQYICNNCKNGFHCDANPRFNCPICRYDLCKNCKPV